MLDAVRLRTRMKQRALSQSELARRIGVSQQAIARLATGEVRGSKHLHRIARELGTTPSYLVGETDDPDANAPSPRPEPQVQHLTLAVALPSEPRLAEAFRAILSASGDMTQAELARELARRLPLILRAAAAGAPSPSLADDDALDEPDEDLAGAPPPARRAAGR